MVCLKIEHVQAQSKDVEIETVLSKCHINVFVGSSQLDIRKYNHLNWKNKNMFSYNKKCE